MKRMLNAYDLSSSNLAYGQTTYVEKKQTGSEIDRIINPVTRLSKEEVRSRLNSTFRISVKRAFVETKEVTKSGKAKIQPIYVRQVFITTKAVSDSGQYKCTHYRRKFSSNNGLELTVEDKFSVNDMVTDKKIGTFDYQEFQKWLEFYFDRETVIGIMIDIFGEVTEKKKEVNPS